MSTLTNILITTVSLSPNQYKPRRCTSKDSSRRLIISQKPVSPSKFNCSNTISENKYQSRPQTQAFTSRIISSPSSGMRSPLIWDENGLSKNTIDENIFIKSKLEAYEKFVKKKYY